MKVHFAMLSVLISISLAFALFSGYKLYKAQAITPVTPQEAVAQIIEVTPSAEAPAATEKTSSPTPASSSTPPSSPPASASSPKGSSRSGGGGNLGSASQPSPSILEEPKEPQLRKLATVSVSAGSIIDIAVTK